MSTIIYPSPIFGPVNSRRLGVSLGINLMPSDGKVCSFDCVYCECGFNADFRPKKKRPTREEVREGLEKVLKERHDNNQPLDDITFAGNGEPTGHPDFKGIVEDTMELCKKYFPGAQVSVLSNATYIYKEEVREALMLVDNNILKLDTVDMDYIKKLDRPQQPNYNVKDVIKYLKMLNTRYFIIPLQGGQTVPLQNPYAYGNAWFVDNIKYVDNANQEIDAVGTINLRHEAVADKKFADVLGTAQKQGNTSLVTLKKYDANELTYTVQSQKGGIVVFSEVYYPGWTATVDGVSVPVGRVNYILRAINVKPGQHTVVLTFKPQSVKNTETAAYVAYLLLVLLS